MAASCTNSTPEVGRTNGRVAASRAKRPGPHCRHIAGIGACLWALSESAAAGSVTLYGLADVAIRYESNQDARNRGTVRMTQGPISPSRFGFRGSEVLNEDLRAFFQLEAGFNIESGTLAGARAAQRLFHRWALVGLESKRYGQITFGRQPSLMFDSLASTFDPMTIANYDGNSWLPGTLSGGVFLDNTVKYRYTIDGLTLLASYSFGYDTNSTGPNGYSGGIAGTVGAGSMRGLGAIYQRGNWGFAGIWQQGRDNSNRRRDALSTALTYQLGHTVLAAGYMRSQDNTGGVDARFNRGLIAPSPATSYKGTNRIDDGFYMGATWRPDAAWTVIGAWYFDRMRNATHGFTNAGQPIKGIGQRHSWAAQVQYALSKSVYTYAEADFGMVSGAATVNFPGSRYQYGGSVGVGKRF